MKEASVSSILIALVLLAVAIIAEAQHPKKVPRSGYLSQFNPASESARAEGIRLALRALGHIEGQNIAIEYLMGRGSAIGFPRLPDVTKDFGNEARRSKAPRYLREILRSLSTLLRQG